MSNETPSFAGAPGALPPEPPLSRPAPGILGLFHGVLFRPSETFRAYPMERAMGPAALALLLSSLIGGLALNTPGAGGLMLAVLVMLGWNVLFWLVSAAALYVVARTMRHQGEFVALLAATGLAFLPTVLVGPLSVAMGWGTLGTAIAALGGIALLVWFARVYIASVAGVTGLSVSRSVAAVIISQLFLLAVPFGALVLSIMTIVALLQSAG